MILDAACGRGTGESGCDTPRTFTTDCGGVEISDGPREGECSWAISVKRGFYVNVTLVQFTIEDTGEEGVLSCSL